MEGRRGRKRRIGKEEGENRGRTNRRKGPGKDGKGKRKGMAKGRGGMIL